MNNKLLVIIDPQNDFTSNNGFYGKKHPISQITEAKQAINALLALWDKNDIVVVYSDYHKGQFEQGLDIGIPGTYGHKIDDDFHFDDGLKLISKSQHSAFSSGEFKEYLNEKKPERLFLCGFLAEYCVKQTAIGALGNGYQVSLIENCIGTGDDRQARKHNMLAELNEKGIEIVHSYELD